MPKQVLFTVEEFDKHAGIILDNGDVICGCCGRVYPAAEKNKTWRILKELKDWYYLESAIYEGANDDSFKLNMNEVSTVISALNIAKDKCEDSIKMFKQSNDMHIVSNITAYKCEFEKLYDRIMKENDKKLINS